MRAHLKYLRYVLLHKFYVLRAGLAIAKHVGRPQSRVAWLWRLLVHDLSKFSRAEWTPYVRTFYASKTPFIDAYEKNIGHMLADPVRRPADMAEEAIVAQQNDKRYQRDTQAAFNAAWLHHIHANPHHWQHHILHEDSGKTIVLLPAAPLVFEMVADWLAAGPKALRAHSMAEAVSETIVWYAANHRQQQIRTHAKETAESILHALAEHYGVVAAAREIESAQRTRESIIIPGR